MASDLARLLVQARAVPMTSEQREAQRRSFAFGNVAIESPKVTRALVERVADDMAKGRR